MQDDAPHFGAGEECVGRQNPHHQGGCGQVWGNCKPIWQAMKDDETLTAVVRSRQLHIYRNGKKILILAGKAQPKIIREDKLNKLITQ